MDSFFPFLEEIEKEVMAIDNLVFSGSTEHTSAKQIIPETPVLPLFETNMLAQKEMGEKATSSADRPLYIDEKHASLDSASEDIRPRFVRPRLTVPFAFRRWRRFLGGTWSRVWKKSDTLPNATNLTLRRMARTRKLVTTLGRLLGTKSDVVTQIRKRLLAASQSGLGNRMQTKGEELEVAIYMGDVQGMLVLTMYHIASRKWIQITS